MSRPLAPVANRTAAQHYGREQRERSKPVRTPAYQQGVSGMDAAISAHADKLHPTKRRGSQESGYALGEVG